MVSGYPTSTNSPRVDGLSTDPQDLGCHKKGKEKRKEKEKMKEKEKEKEKRNEKEKREEEKYNGGSVS